MMDNTKKIKIRKFSLTKCKRFTENSNKKIPVL